MYNTGEIGLVEQIVVSIEHMLISEHHKGKGYVRKVGCTFHDLNFLPCFVSKPPFIGCNDVNGNYDTNINNVWMARKIASDWALTRGQSIMSSFFSPILVPIDDVEDVDVCVGDVVVPPVVDMVLPRADAVVGILPTVTKLDRADGGCDADPPDDDAVDAAANARATAADAVGDVAETPLLLPPLPLPLPPVRGGSMALPRLLPPPLLLLLLGVPGADGGADTAPDVILII
jgi:hypothetical protein